MQAELVADSGAAAVEPEFFRSGTFLAAEGVTHSLVVGDGRLVVPLIRREIRDGLFDAISPYGYPGGTVIDAPVPVSEIDFSGTGLVSIFLRDRLGAPAITGGDERGEVLLHRPDVPRSVQRRVATKARSNERAGYRFEPLPAKAVDDDLVDAFTAAYTETMDAAAASDRYYYSADYLRACLLGESSWLAAVWGPDGDLAAGAIAVLSDGYLHYYLGGTADAHRSRSPAKNMMIGMIDLADELGVPLNLGGGMRHGDSLHTFKASFTNAASPYVTHSIVCDEEAYAALAGDADGTAFFPAYRAPRAR
ncbi:GNAT family N-acetyltransferase [Pseudonocardia sp. TRM90224]|uniref:GNAT family N-acetyltransferase n=1 Tax=Pseudonocardia sp. TRM90224 TaxID=2812678 RepID=UPI001E48CE66|nr:GNAT family N-acetyltransferase [Pseudonocardia sp. TRM90224]